MRVPDTILECVVFLGFDEPADKPGLPARERYAGTAFLVGFEGQSLPGRWYSYLVTAAHVVERIEGDCWVRINRIEGGTTKIDLGDAPWVRHPDGRSVDVAALPFQVSTMDQRVIPTTMMLVTPEMFSARNIGVGDEVFMTGVFASASGHSRNTPILRTGTIAMLPDEKIPTKDLGEIQAYLVETHSFGGISGSPVFVQETVSIRISKGDDPPGTPPNILSGTGSHFLLGLVHGHWEVDEKDVSAYHVRSAPPGEPSINLGISIVVPASKILEVLNQPHLLQMRSDSEREAVQREQIAAPSATDENESPKRRM